ncbi:hypothetical protein J7399_17775 [Shimia sp. R9_1]|uniref:hypothetical protein n=1 Tax=Shimia sp. R9_1 TaxID=2821111 RepID=UPI001ADC5AA2|nr:hypothetical protein [Shimia sp. R9_1]MBO9409290.1 hypothetical protein [Shimia sp. R9_1]
MSITKITLSFSIAFSGLIALAQPSTASGVKPDHVYQVTEALVQELQVLNQENFTKSATAATPDDDAMPRHVLFLARDQWRKVQLLRFMNGLETHGLNQVKVHKVTPAEVKEFVDQLLIEAQDLRPTYGLEESTISVDLQSGKKPKDVYGSLLRVSGELKALGVPATVPNDVFRVAVSIRQSLSAVLAKQGLSINESDLAAESGRTPSEAYHAGLSLLQDLQSLSENDPAFAVPGKITVPAAKSGPISPDDVIVVLSRAYADTMALMNATNAAPHVVFAPYEGGKTPSDVYREIKHAQLILAALTKPSI